MQLIHDEVGDAVFMKIIQQRLMLLQARIADSDVNESDDSG
jgi:hypothetical protein